MKKIRMTPKFNFGSTLGSRLNLELQKLMLSSSLDSDGYYYEDIDTI